MKKRICVIVSVIVIAWLASSAALADNTDLWGGNNTTYWTGSATTTDDKTWTIGMSPGTKGTQLKVTGPASVKYGQPLLIDTAISYEGHWPYPFIHSLEIIIMDASSGSIIYGPQVISINITTNPYEPIENTCIISNSESPPYLKLVKKKMLAAIVFALDNDNKVLASAKWGFFMY